jgi:ABC-2 type transport system permease protein
VNSYRANKTLPYRVELIRQIKRRRTAVAYALMVALPLIVVAAVKLGPQSNSSSSSGGGESNFGSGSLNLIGLATNGTWNFTLVMLLFGSGFLLTTVFALFAGDTVASEASWSTLRYLLATPVPRRRLLFIKLAVGLTLSLGAITTLVVASLAIGAIAFGTAPLTSPLGGTFESTEALTRIAIITAYIAVTLLFTSGVAFLMTVVTDVPLGAVGTSVMIVIVSQILDALEALGDLRQWLPSHYARAWTDVLAPTIDWTSMARGAAFSVIGFTIFVVWSVLKFDKKDVLS